MGWRKEGRERRVQGRGGTKEGREEGRRREGRKEGMKEGRCAGRKGSVLASFMST